MRGAANFFSKVVVLAGAACIAVAFFGPVVQFYQAYGFWAWEAWQIHHVVIDSSLVSTLSFYGAGFVMMLSGVLLFLITKD